jgi:metallophosphoesterase (TIGR03768 family)
MLYTTQVLDAAIQTINALHKENPFDFGIGLGDACNSAQYNELRWYIDVIDGKLITPSSGTHVGATTIDYQKPYQAAGLDKSINWYQVLGNHDHFWGGTLPPNDYVKRTAVGRNILNIGDIQYDPRGLDSRGFYMGSIDGRTPYGDIIGVGPTSSFSKIPTVLAADLDRRILSRHEWIAEFFNTSSKPSGHGFSLSNVNTGFACYSFEPKSTIPLKVIVLDDTQRDDDPNDPVLLGYGRGSYGYAHGSLDTERYNWLIGELDSGQLEDKLMIIAAHVPIGFEFAGTSGALWNATLREKLISKLHTYPNLIMWMSGHVHINKITALKSPDAAHPELGFWEVQTASLRDFPQQFRSFEIVRNSDNTISIFATDVDPSVKDSSPAAMSRIYAIANSKLFPPFYDAYAEAGADLYPHNAELFKQLTPKMQEKIKKYGTPLL